LLLHWHLQLQLQLHLLLQLLLWLPGTLRRVGKAIGLVAAAAAATDAAAGLTLLQELQVPLHLQLQQQCSCC
jgi:hypothetical protein